MSFRPRADLCETAVWEEDRIHAHSLFIHAELDATPERRLSSCSADIMPFDPQFAKYVAAATVLMTLQPIITSASKVEGRYEYLQVSVTLLAELSKMALSLVMYLRLPPSVRTHQRITCGHLMQFATPAAIYFVNNNLVFVILAYVNSTTFQILSSLKTVFTGLLFRVMLKRPLTDVQSLAIVLLACGTAISQLSGGVCDATARTDSTAVGLACAVLTCLLSALGGVHSERLMKDGEHATHSIHLQNMLLYLWGIGFNSLTLLGADGARVLSGELLRGYTPVVWALVANNALNGLAISAVLKYTDNIVRVFAHAAAMLLTLGLENVLLGAEFTPQLLLSAMVVACAVYLYNRREGTPTISEQQPPQPPQQGQEGHQTPQAQQTSQPTISDADEARHGIRRFWPLRYEGGKGVAADEERQPLMPVNSQGYVDQAFGGNVTNEFGDGPRLTRHPDGGYRLNYARRTE
jgi:UDP-galactose transporter